MDAKAIADRTKILEKAAEGGESSAILNVLAELRKGVSATEQSLRSTRVGVTVAKFKNSKNPEIARTAGELISKWKKDVGKNKGAAANGQKKHLSVTPTTPTTPTSAGPMSPVGTTNKMKTENSSVPPEQRDHKKDKVDVAKTGVVVRDKCVGMMYDGLVYLSELPTSAVLGKACAVEEAVFSSYGPETSEPYKQKMRSLFQNLKIKSNTKLREHVLNGVYAPEKFATMTTDDLKSEKMKEEDAELERLNMREAQAPVQEFSISSTFKCNGCGKQEVSYTQAQTRSADEPMTTFCKCQNCGKRWKVCFPTAFIPLIVQTTYKYSSLESPDDAILRTLHEANFLQH